MKNQQFAFAFAGSVMTILFLFIVNQLTSPDDIWFFHPTLLILQWPLAIYFAARGMVKQFAAVDSLLIVGCLYVDNMLYTPDHLWFLYAAFAIVWWPILLYAGRFAKTLAMAIIGSASVIVSYTFLNVFVSPEFPWAIFPAYAVLWWPLAIYCGRRGRWFLFSILGATLSALLFVTVNAITTEEIWAIYPIFAIVWWPLSMYYYYANRQTA
ncbi:hypothetical protein [Cohnella sp. GCM10027633]|uniref:hypothetical protein n=1 Tax=unclassified Cohnella TaxID=2636738 RepID=UPI0036345943